MNDEAQMTADQIQRVNEEIRRVNDEIRRVNEEIRKTNDEIRKSNQASRKAAEAEQSYGRHFIHEHKLLSTACHRTGFHRSFGQYSPSRVRSRLSSPGS